MRASSTVVADHAVGTLWSAASPDINNTVTFGTTSTANSFNSHTFIGRNGTNVTLGGDASGNIIVSPSGVTLTNSLQGGTLTLGASAGTGNISMAQNAMARAITIGGSGDTVVNGSLLLVSTTSTAGLVKTGVGMLTINGTASTYTGNTTVTGTLSMGDLGAINKTSTTGSVLLSSGTLLYTGGADTLAKPFSLTNATGNNAVLSSGTGPLTLTGNVASSGIGAKTLYLGGSNASDNTFSSLLLDNNVGGTTTGPTGLSKIGAGTWVLTAPTAAAYGSSSTIALSAVTTASSTMTLSAGTTSGLLVGQVLAGVGTNNEITSILDATHFTISISSTVSAGNFTVNAIPATSTTTAGGTWSGPLTVSGGTLKLSATSSSSNIVQDSNAVVFNADSATAYSGNQFAGGTLNYVNNASATAGETLGSLTPTAGAGKVAVTANGQTTTLIFGAASPLLGRTAEATLDYQPGTGVISLTTAPVLQNGLLTDAAGKEAYATFNGWIGHRSMATMSRRQPTRPSSGRVVIRPRTMRSPPARERPTPPRNPSTPSRSRRPPPGRFCN